MIITCLMWVVISEVEDCVLQGTRGLAKTHRKLMSVFIIKDPVYFHQAKGLW